MINVLTVVSENADVLFVAATSIFIVKATTDYVIEAIHNIRWTKNMQVRNLSEMQAEESKSRSIFKKEENARWG